MGEQRAGNTFELRKSTVFVDNLPNGIRKGFVYNLFSRFGKIRDCYIPDKKSKRSGQSFGFVRFESIKSAILAVESINRSWIWGRELIVNVAKFVKKQSGIANKIYNQYQQKNPEPVDGFRNRQRPNDQHPNPNPQLNNGNAIGNGKDLVIYQQNTRFQRKAPISEGFEKRGTEEWRKKGFSESNNQRGIGNLRSQEDAVKTGSKTITVQPVGNGWLSRSAVGKIRRLISAQDLESLFKKENLGNVQIKPMGGRYVIITFPSEDRRNEMLKEKWLDLWFEETKPWNGEAAKDERFVWLACYGMPLNAWNTPSFRAIGSSWGCFIEVDNVTLREISYTKGRILIATENPNKIEGVVQLVVGGSNYRVRVQEEESFRAIPPINSAPFFEVSSENGEDDAVVNRSGTEVDANKFNNRSLVDDMEDQGKGSMDDRAKINKEEAEKVETKCINSSHQVGMGKEQEYEEPPAQRKSMGGENTEKIHSSENVVEDSFNSDLGLDSIVQDSQSPLIEECFESEHKNQDEEKEANEDINVGACESNIPLRASQLPVINLHVELNPSAVRRSIRSQQLEDSESVEEDDIGAYIMGSQEQEPDAIEKELQYTISAGNTLGIKMDNSGISRMKTMIEKESRALKDSIKSNLFAPLMRD